MAFSLKAGASMKSVGKTAGRRSTVTVRAGKYDEELIKTAVSWHTGGNVAFVPA